MSDARDANALYDEATKLKQSGDLEGAIGLLRQALEADPDHLHAHSALGVYLQQAGQPEEAIQHAVRVTELEPSDPFSFTQLSVIYMRCGRIPEAETAMERARQLQMQKG